MRVSGPGRRRSRRGSHSKWLHSNGREDGNPSLAPRQDTETKDRPPPKQTYPFEGTVLESFSLSHQPRAALRGGSRRSVLTVIMWILDGRARENKQSTR